MHVKTTSLCCHGRSLFLRPRYFYFLFCRSHVDDGGSHDFAIVNKNMNVCEDDLIIQEISYYGLSLFVGPRYLY